MAETIKEFLVSVGYTVDGGSEEKFKRSIEAATKGATELGLALIGAAAAVTATVTKIAAGFDQLYYASQRTNSSVQSLRGMAYAVSQLGGSADGAMASMEGLALKLRSNPGYESLVRSLGVATTQNGKLRETTAIAEDLAKVLAKKPAYIAMQYGEALGLDEQTMKALQSGELTRYLGEYAAKTQALGVDQARSAEIGRDLTQAWRSLSATFDLIGAKLEEKLGPSMAKFVHDTDDFLIKNSDKIVAFFETAAKAAAWLADTFGKVVAAATPMWEVFDKVAQSITGQSGLQVVMEAFAVWMIRSWLTRILGAFGAVGADWGTMLLKLGINPVTLGAAGILLGSTTEAGAGEDEEIARRKAAGTFKPTTSDDEITKAAPPKDDRSWYEKIAPLWAGGKPAPTATSVNMEIPAEGRALLDTIASTESPGYNTMYGGKKFDSYADHPRTAVPITSGPNAGRTSSAAGRYQFLASTWDSQARKLGLTDFSPANQDLAAYDLAKTVYQKKTERDLESDLKSGDPDIIAGVGRALSGTWTSLPGGIEQGQGGGRMAKRFNRYLADQQTADQQTAEAGKSSLSLVTPTAAGTMDQQAKIASRIENAFDMMSNVQTNAATIGGASAAPLVMPSAQGGTSVDMTQSTQITVLGGSDPIATGNAVADAQKGVNSGLLRNMTGAVR